MTLILPYDTETTGVPDWHTPSNDPCQPHLVSLAAILLDEDSLVVSESMNVIVRPDGWSWTEDDEAFKTHGITVERAMDEGIPEKHAVEQLLHLWNKCDFRVGHNVSFDNRIMRIAIKRYFDDVLADKWKEGKHKCTGTMTKPIMKMPASAKAQRFGKYKMPKLEEAYEYFTGRPLVNAHNALADCQACLEVYMAARHIKPEPETASSARATLGLKDEFTFGKHKGKQVEDVLNDFPNYITWAISEGVVTFDEEAMEMITRKGAA